VPLVPEDNVDDGGKEEDERSDKKISRRICFQSQIVNLKKNNLFSRDRPKMLRRHKSLILSVV
jgi:hypothetical protein